VARAEGLGATFLGAATAFLAAAPLGVVFLGVVFLAATPMGAAVAFFGAAFFGAVFLVEAFLGAAFVAVGFLPATGAATFVERARGFAGAVPDRFGALAAVFALACAVVALGAFFAAPAVAFTEVAPRPVFNPGEAGVVFFAAAPTAVRTAPRLDCTERLPVAALCAPPCAFLGAGRRPRTGFSSFVTTFECRPTVHDDGSAAGPLPRFLERWPPMSRLKRPFAALRVYHARKATARKFEAVVASFDPPSVYSIVAQELAVDDCYAVDWAAAGTLETIRASRSRLESSMRHGAWVSAHFADGSALWLASPSMLPGRGFCLVDWFPARSYVELRFVRRGKKHTVWADAVLLSPFRRNLDVDRHL
jgi:hypothetical protein